MTAQPPPFGAVPIPPARVREGLWLVDLVAAWILVALLAIATVLMDLAAAFVGTLFLMCADDESGGSCRGFAQVGDHAAGTLGLAWLPVVAAVSGVVILGRRRVPVFWVPLVAAALSAGIVLIGIHTVPRSS